MSVEILASKLRDVMGTCIKRSYRRLSHKALSCVASCVHTVWCWWRV